MEYFHAAKVVRLRTRTNKYLVASHDTKSVSQSRDGTNRKARWTVEIVHGNKIRLQSCYNKYLSASDESFLLGWTGRKAIQSSPSTDRDVSVEWEPVREGHEVRLRARKGDFLRANRGPPPYKGTVTVDEANEGRKGKGSPGWVLWGIDILVTVDEWEEKRCGSTVGVLTECETQRFSTEDEDEEEDCDDEFSVCGSSLGVEDQDLVGKSFNSSPSSSSSSSGKSWMELFRNAKTIRLRSRHDKYLIAESRNDNVIQDRNGDGKNARWTVEYLTNAGVQLIRLRSIYAKYLTPTDEPFLTGKTGNKVKQRIPPRLDSSVEWEPIRDGMQVKLKTRYGNYLRANGGLPPPWRNTVTHDVPSSNHTQDWIFWEVDVIEVYPPQVNKPEMEAVVEEDEPEMFMPEWMKSNRRSEGSNSSVTFPKSSAKNEGRAVAYNIVDDDGKVVDEGRPLTINFNGDGLTDLKQMLEEITCLEDIIMCSRNPLNGKLYPLRLALPPQHVKMHVFVVPPSSQAAGDLAGP